MRTASVVPFINVNTSIQGMLMTQPSSTNSTYLQPTKTRLRRLRNLFAGAAHRKRQGTTAATNHFQDNLREDILLAPVFTMRTASVVPSINVNTSIQDMLTTQPSSTISTYLRPIKTRLRRLRKRPKHVLRLRSLAQWQALDSKPDIIGSRPLGVGDAGHICGRSRPHLWAMNTQPTRQLPTLRS